jgi:DNA repair exonuclease SbcCD ATPase subunit
LIKLLSSEINGCGHFSSVQKIEWDKRGLVLLAGGEGYGKTTILDSLPLAISGKGAPRVGAAALTDLTVGNGVIPYLNKVKLQAHGKDVRIQWDPSLSFYVNNVRDDTVGKVNKKNALQSLLGISYDEWLGSVYIPQSSAHDLFAGTPADRMAFVTKAFGLAFYQDLVAVSTQDKKDLAAKLKSTLDIQQRLANITREVQAAKSELDGLPETQDALDHVEKTNKLLLAATKELGRLSNVQKQYQQKLLLTDELAALPDEIADVSGQLADVKAAIATITQQKAAAERIAKQRVAATMAMEKGIALEQKGLSNIAKAKEYVKDLPSVEALTRARTLWLKYPDAIEFRGDTSKSIEDYQSEESAALSSLKKVQTLLDKKTHVCPTCTQDLSHDELKDMLSLYANNTKTARQGANTAFTLKLLSIIPTWMTATEVNEALDKHSDLAALSVNYKTTLAALESAKENLANIPDDIVVPDMSDLLKQHDDLSAIAEQQRKRQSILDKLSQYDKDLSDVSELLVQEQEKQHKFQKKYDAAISTKEDVLTTQARYDTLVRQQANIKKEVDKTAKEVLRLKCLDDELIPYFKSVLAGKIQNALDRVTSVLPMYMACVSTGQYIGSEIMLNVTPDYKTVEMMIRTKGNQTFEKPIVASGGQQRRFTSALVGAIVEASVHKTNVLLLDEPFANLRTEGKYALLERLIPTIQERNPNITSVIISAHDKEILQMSPDTFTDVWIVENDGVKSNLTTGRKLSDV